MMSYILLIVVTLAIGFGAQAYVNSQIKKYSLDSLIQPEGRLSGCNRNACLL